MLHRRSTRLRNFDYSRSGYYFITICTYKKQEYFGCILYGKMILNQVGIEAMKCWLLIPDHFQNAVLDEIVIMPDHIHCILKIKSPDNYSGFRLKRRNKFQHIIPGSLGSIIRGFKTGVTKWVREQSPGLVVWQRNYYDRIIRNESELKSLRRYIQLNPKKWWDSQNHVNQTYRINLYRKNIKF